MRSSVVARTHGTGAESPRPIRSRILSSFLAAVLAVGLLPAQALAVEDSLAPIPGGSEGAVRTDPSAEEGGRGVLALPPDDPSAADAGGAASTSEDVDPIDDAEGAAEDATADEFADDANLGTPILAGDIINQEMALSTVAQAESTRSYFLAQTLESTKTVPVVSAKLPLDQGANQQPQAGADGGQIAVGSEDKVTDGDLPAASTEAGSDDEAEGGEDSDESDLAGVVTLPGVAAESTVVGSFTYLGMTFAVEPGGESVALVAADYSKLPDELVQKQIIVIPDMATPDGLDYYSVARIANNAFASLTKETANPDYTGCIELFSDEELLAEAGISQEEVQEFLDAEPVENDPIEPSDEIRTIVSMDGNVATLDDGSTYTFTNPLAGCAGILALGIPASVTSIENEAFAGADTLQYIIVFEDNSEYSAYDGALYNASQTILLSVPEGREGALVMATSVADLDSETPLYRPAFSTLVASEDYVKDWLFAKIMSRTQQSSSWGGAFSSSNAFDVRFVEGAAETVTLTKDSQTWTAKTSGPAGTALAKRLGPEIGPSAVYFCSLRDFDQLTSDKLLISDLYTLSTVSAYPVTGVLAPFGSGYACSVDCVSLPYNTGAYFRVDNPNIQVGPGSVLNAGYAGTFAMSGTNLELYVAHSSTGTKYDSLYFNAVAGLSAGTGPSTVCPMRDFSMLPADYTWNPNKGAAVDVTAYPIVYCEQAVLLKSVRSSGQTDGAAVSVSLPRPVLAYIPPPYTISVTYDANYTDYDNGSAKVSGSWTSEPAAGEDSSYSFDSSTKIASWDTGIDEDGEKGVDIVGNDSVTATLESKYLPVPDTSSITSGYTFVGWNAKQSTAADKVTAATTDGWYYRADDPNRTNSRYSYITEPLTASTTLYAVYQKGYPVTWDTERFGSTSATFQQYGANISAAQAQNTHSVAVGGSGNSTEVAVIERTDDTAQLSATSRFPKVKRADDDQGGTSKTRFLGWTNNADGSVPSRTNADGSAKRSAYFSWDDGVIKLDKDNFYIVRESAQDKLTKDLDASDILEKYSINDFRNATWYAVWETDVTYEAPSYGGKFENNGGADAVTVTVFNNRPIEQESLPANDKTNPSSVGAGTLSKTLVPMHKDQTGYDGTKWTFKGWTTSENPNGATGGTTQSASGLGCRTGSVSDGDRDANADVSGTNALRPDGATTYYGVWECDVSWATEHPVTGPDENGATITSSVNAGTTSGDGVNTGWFLYGYTIGSAPGVVTPQSHAFLRWVDPLGRADKAIASATGALVVDTGGVWNATWGPNIYKVAFKGADGQDRELGSIYMKYGDGWYSSYAPASSTTDASVSGPIHGDGNVLRGGTVRPAVRDGFICVGYALDPDAKAPEYFYTTDDEGRYVFDNGENPIPPTIFNDKSRGTTAGVGSEADLKVGYLYPVWRADIAWDYANSTQSSAGDNKVEEQTLYVNNRDGVWGGADEPALGTSAFPSVTVRDQGARAGYVPGKDILAADPPAVERTVDWEVAYAPASLGTDELERTDRGQSYSIKGSATMTAQWTANEYDINFDLGTLDYKGQTLAQSAGYDADGTGIVKNSLTWKNNGGAEGAAVSATARYTVVDDKVVLPTFSRPGKAFLGWIVNEAGRTGADAQGPGTLLGTADDPLTDYAFATGSAGASSVPLQVRGNIKLTAVWGDAVPYELAGKATEVYLDGQPLTDPAMIARLYADKAAGGAFDLPKEYYASGLPLSDPTARAGYAFAGWKACLAADSGHTMLMEVGGSPLDNLAGEPAKQGSSATALQIRPDTTGDGAVVLRAYFTSDTYDLELDLTLPDADKKGGTYTGANWEVASGGEGKTFSYRNDGFPNSDKSGYSLYETSISIPAPARKGQTFDGWTLLVKDASGSYVAASDTVAAAVLGGTEGSDPCTFTVDQDHLADYRLKAKWSESLYTISFSGLDHVNDATAGEKTARFVEVSAGAAGANTFGAATFGFDGDTLTAGHTVVVRELTAADYDTARYDGFKGWYLPAGTGNLGGLFAEDAATGRFYATSLVVDQAHLDELFGTSPGDDGRMVLELQAVFEPKADYALTIDLAGGTYNVKQPDGTYVEQKPAGFADKAIDADGHATYARTYSCESGPIALPDPSRYGYEFLGWTLTGTGLGPDGAGEVGKGWTVSTDSVGERTYTARWKAAEDRLLLYNNLKSVYPDMPDDASPIERRPVFGSPLPTGFAKPLDPAATATSGYVFVGYFDTPATTGGKQYYALNASGAVVSVRDWDKAPEFEEDGTTVIPHALYARWEAVAPEGTPDANKTQNAYGANARIEAKVDGMPSTTDSLTAFSGTYNGRFTHEASGRITVKVNSYAFADGTSAKSVYDAFNATRAADAAEKYLCGFVVESTGEVIAFSDLALGRAFEVSFKEADRDGSVPEPGFSLLPEGVYAIYSSTPFDFESGEGGEPPSLDPVAGKSTIIALFDANGGSFADGRTNVHTTTLYGPDAGAGQSLTVALPAAPAREGYEFAGWALTQAHVEGDHAASAAGSSMFDIVDITTKRYFAHWNVRTCTVKLHLGYDGSPAPATIHVPFDSTAHLASYDGTAAFAEPTPREGYVFLGWFDDGNTGLQYFTSTGAATRPWDYEADPAGADAVTLSAHWLDLNAPNTGSDSDPEKPVPADPFPGQEVAVTPTANGNDQLRMPARGAYAEGGAAAVALDGTYDGLFYATEPVSDASEVAVVLYAYAPATVHDDVRHIISSYEANAPAGIYLQGFRIGSTNSFISIADLYAGNPVTFYLSGTDLVNGVADRASVVFASGKVEAEYGPTQQVPPASFEGEEWPDMSANPPAPSPLPQVHNTFDARAGAFEDGLRFVTVDSGYGEPVRIPAEEPALEDPTYHFDAWYYVNARGEMCELEVDENGLALSLKATSVAPMTFYARYVRTYYDFTVVDAQDGVKDIHLSDGGAERTVGAFSPYEGETLTLMNDEFACMADSLGTRDGYDFIGYFYRTGDAGSYTYRPFYLTGRAENAYAWNYATKMRYDEDFAKLDAHASGWSQLEGIGGSDELDPTKVTLYALWQPIVYDIIWQYNWDGRTLGSQQIEYVYLENGVAKAPTVTENVLFGDSIYDLIPQVSDPAFSFEGWYASKNTTGGTTDRVAFRQVIYNGGHDADTRNEYERFSTSGAKRYFTNHVTGSSNPSDLSFEPVGFGTLPANKDTGNRCFTFFAGFTGQSEGYKYRIYLSQTADNAHWQVSADLHPVTPADGSAYIEYDYQPQYNYNLTKQFDGKITAATGYRKSGWYAAPDSTERIDLDGDVVIPQWSCGLKEFYIGWDHNAYSIGLKLNTLDVGAVDEEGARVLSTPQGTLLLAPEGNDFAMNLDMSVEERTIALPDVNGAIGYRFVGWKRCDEQGRLFVDDELGTTFPVHAAGDSILVDESFIADRWNFAGADEGSIYYGAVWEPYTYEVRFHARPEVAGEEDEYDTYELVSNTTPDSSGSSFVLPYPHTTLAGDAFRFWSLMQQDPRDPSPCASWKSGSSLTLDEVFAAQKDMPGFAEKFEGGKAVIDLWSQWTTIASSTVPLTVNVLIDPWNPYREDGAGKIITNEAGYYVEGADGQVGWTADDGSGQAPQNVVANAWLGTSSGNAVRIESLTFERETNGVFATAQGDKADLFELLVYAGGTGQKSEPLRINLAGEVDGRTIFLRDETSGQDTHLGPNPDYLSNYAGFDTEIVKGSPLLIHYDLTWDASLTDLGAFTTLVDPSKLLDASATSGTTLGRATLPIAKLYYTIGLAH